MTITIKRAAMLAGAAVAGVLAVPAAAAADEVECTGTIAAVTVDNVRVPQGRACSLDGTLVKGTVKVERDATLDANAVEVIGNVQAEGAASVVVRGGSSVGGSIQVKQGGAAETIASQVTGDIQYDQQTGPLRVVDNFVGGSVQVVANRGGILVATNTIDGNLQCKENAPPVAGSGNLVHGNAEDQCAAMGGGPGAPSPANGGGGGGQNGDDDDDLVLRRPAARGSTMVFRGRAEQATSGVEVLLQVRRDGRWRSVDDDRTNRRGAYRIAHRFAARRRARTVRVRTLIRPQAAWPSRAVSRVVPVRIAARSSD
jgi:hypothetical protein